MKIRTWFCLLVVATVAFAIGRFQREPQAVAQVDVKNKEVGRYQISAWAVIGKDGFRQPGCFLVDTTNGTVWTLNRTQSTKENADEQWIKLE